MRCSAGGGWFPKLHRDGTVTPTMPLDPYAIATRDRPVRRLALIVAVVAIAGVMMGCTASVDQREGLFDLRSEWPTFDACGRRRAAPADEEDEGMGPAALQKQRKARERAEAEAALEEAPSP